MIESCASVNDFVKLSIDTEPVNPISVRISTTFATDSAESSETTPISIALSTTSFNDDPTSSKLPFVISMLFKSTSVKSLKIFLSFIIPSAPSLPAK